jgi:SAM-dependent methyltransferase
VLDLGATPLANGLLRPGGVPDPEPRFPLVLAVCPACGLAQLTVTVPPEEMFAVYPYFSSFSETMLRESRALAGRLVATRGLGAGSLVVEVASNDGYLLKNYVDRGIPVLGIEPAANVAAVAREKGVRTECEFFGRAFAETLRGRGELADVVHANNVMAHVPDIDGFVAGLATILQPTGVAVIEVPYLRDLIEHVEFDTIYHEHVFYFSVTALLPLFERNGLELTDVERIPIHGGSLRLFVTPAGRRPVGDAVRQIASEERSLGMHEVAYYTAFADRVRNLGVALRETLSRLRADGKRVAAYGASAKGSTLLNAFGIGGETLEFVADRSTVKQGLLTPGTHLPIVPPERLLESMPDYVLLLTWNFAEEILRQQQAYRDRGGKFIVPVPAVTVV